MATQTELTKGSIAVTLGSKQYEIKQLNWGAEKEWRLRVGGYLNRLPMYADMLTVLTAQELLSNQKVVRETSPETEDKPASTLEVNLTKILQQGIATLTQYPEAAYELLLAYSPQLATPEARSDVDENGDVQQIMIAFMGVLKMAYPFFGEMTSLLSGRKPSGTSTNSTPRSGASPTKS